MNINVGVPWLIEALEERYGWFGRRISDALVLAIAAIPFVGLAIIIKKWLWWPESVSFLEQETWEALGIIFIIAVIIGVVVLGVMWLRKRLGL